VQDAPSICDPLPPEPIDTVTPKIEAVLNAVRAHIKAVASGAITARMTTFTAMEDAMRAIDGDIS